MVHLQLVISALFVAAGVFQVEGDPMNDSEKIEHLRKWFGYNDITLSTDDGNIIGVFPPRMEYTFEDFKQALSTCNHRSLAATLGLNENFLEPNGNVDFSNVFTNLILAYRRNIISYETAMIFLEAAKQTCQPSPASPGIDTKTVGALKIVVYCIMRIKRKNPAKRVIVKNLFPQAIKLFFPNEDNIVYYAGEIRRQFFYDLSRFDQHIEVAAVGDEHGALSSVIEIVNFLKEGLPGIQQMDIMPIDNKQMFLNGVITRVINAADLARNF